MNARPAALTERITSVLVANGFVPVDGFRETARTPRFLVTEGAGATVNLEWEAADDAREAELFKMAGRLTTNGLTVGQREGYIYVYARQI